jgi:hypothetical protein
LLPKNQQPPSDTPQFLCPYTNISECLPIEEVDRVSMIDEEIFKKSIISIQFTLTLWNPTIHSVTHLAYVPVTKEYTIRDPMGQIITAEVIEMNEINRLFDLLFSFL